MKNIVIRTISLVAFILPLSICFAEDTIIVTDSNGDVVKIDSNSPYRDNTTTIVQGGGSDSIVVKDSNGGTVKIDSVSKAAEKGFNVLGNMVGGIVGATGGNANEANDAAKGLGVAGKILGGMAGGVAKSADSIVITENGNTNSVVITDNGNSDTIIVNGKKN